MAKMEFKEIRKSIREIFVNYKVFMLKLKLHDEHGHCHYQKNDIQRFKSFVRLVDAVLMQLPEEHTRLLKQIELDNKQYSDLGYCRSSYYHNYKKAATLFMRYYQ
ncbi:MAG: hypothetical protein LBG49_02930 [Mycoplasmataceae bacterium]|jgi:hypothetical protein|nr:hypothetical protein [Mycoplasmataceae bacterium]